MMWNRWPKERDWKQIKRAGVIIITFLIILIFLHAKNITWQNDTKMIIWSGAYFEGIHYSEVDSIVMEDKMPSLKSRSNGYAAFGSKKGYFIRRRDDKRVLLFINRPKSRCIHFFLKEGKEVYLNFDQDRKTLEELNTLKIRIKKENVY